MPDSVTETTDISRRLREHLRTLLPTAEISSAETVPPLPPLLLLQTQHNVAAFALPNGNWRADFDSLYAEFKDLCTRRRRDWEQLDVNFVFCLPHPDDDFDAFSSNVETDVYFCRKFVVPLDRDLPQALARLPFLPLDPLEGGGLRPDSAQVFLQRHGVSSLLARYLVLPHHRGPEEIVNDCLAQQLGAPLVSPALPRLGMLAADRSQEPIRIQRIEIKNFRAYRTPRAFDIASDVTVLYGPNGFGKTSLFDAIDFAVTGGIGRLNALTDHQFTKAAPHLDSVPDESVVTLISGNSSTTLRVERSVGAPNGATLNGERKDRKAILAALTGTASPGSERIDHLVRLFRATHQFNQEVQELTRDFQEDCRLSADIVSRMLAFEDYNNAVGKSGQVRQHLVHRIASCDAIIADADTQAASDREEVRRLSRPTQIDGSASTLQAAIANVRERLVALGLATEEPSVNIAVVRGWRAAVVARHAEHLTKAQRLTELSPDLVALPESRQLLETRSNALAPKERELASAEAGRAEIELACRRALQALDEQLKSLKEFNARKELLEWIRATKPQYVEIVSQERKLGDDLEVMARQIRDQRKAEEKLAVDFQAAEADAIQRTARTISLKGQLSLLTTLLETYPRYLEQRDRLKALESENRTFDQDLTTLQRSLGEETKKQGDLAAEEKRVDAEIRQAAGKQSELHRLLIDLAGHIHSGICPLCAADYGARENLVNRIQAHDNAAVASESQQQLQEIREKFTATKQRIADLVATKLATEKKLAMLRTEKNEIEVALTDFRRSTEGSGLNPDAPPDDFIDEVQRRSRGISLEVAEHEGLASEKQRLLATLRDSLAANRQISHQKQFERDEKTKTLTGLKAELLRMRNDPRLGETPLDIGEDQLITAESLNTEHIDRTNDSVRSAGRIADQRRTELTAARARVAALQPEVNQLRLQIAAGKKWIAEVEARLEAQNLAPTITPDELADLVKEESRKEADLALLGDSTNNLEIAFDAATTAAALSRMSENIRAAEKRKANAESDRSQLRPWETFFRDLSSLLSAQQDMAIANFTREYGPRASVIQRRLRSVYGFDDITLNADGSDIVVRATRRGETLRPIDYFSQSQQQSLMLALFLTACSSQTWSSFCPVLLDDPVTHFDDLNTYAFLDLLVGLLDAGSSPRQFILSTCDDRVFQLARQKFRHLGSRAAFYAFLSCGEDGPEIESLTTS